MNQNIPNNPEHAGSQTGAPGADEHDAYNAAADSENPYFAKQKHIDSVELDAGEPVLRSSEIKRLNRKALFFLACIVVVLMLIAYWLLAKGGGEPRKTAAKPRSEAVEVPALPQQVAGQSAGSRGARPVPLAERADLPPLPPMPREVEPEASAFASRERGPSLLDRRIQAAGGGGDATPQLPFQGAPAQSSASPFGAEQAGADLPTSATPIRNPDGLLVRGTYIRCVLETRIITDFPGFTSCIVTEPVYSINGRNLLLPKGSKILGQYGAMEPTGPRMQVIWDRITTPTGIDVSLMGPGVDNLGSAGHPGQYSAHWASRISSAILISMISDAFKWAAAEHGPSTTTVGLGTGIITEQPYESNTAKSVQRLADQALDRSGRRAATVTINQGAVLNVYVAKDVDFTAVLSN